MSPREYNPIWIGLKSLIINGKALGSVHGLEFNYMVCILCHVCLDFTFIFIRLADTFIKSKLLRQHKVHSFFLFLLWMWHRWHLCRCTGPALTLRGNGAVEVVALLVLMHSSGYSHSLGMRAHSGFTQAVWKLIIICSVRHVCVWTFHFVKF